MPAALLGVAAAFAIVRVFKAIGGHAIPRLDAVTTGWPVLAWGLGSAMVAAVTAATLPALRASRMAPIEVLKSGGPKSSAGRGERRLLRGVTMVQTALTLALLVGAGLLIRTMSKLADVASGYRTDHILTATVTAVRGDWADFHNRALERVAALPGVDRVAFAWGVPLTGNSWPGNIDIEGLPEARTAGERISIPLRAVTTGYFTLIGMPLVDGRDVRSTDDRKAPLVAVVNKAMVDRYFPGGGAIGKHIWMGGRSGRSFEIVGVVANGRTGDLARPPEPEVYFSLWQNSAFSKDLVVSTAADPRAVMAAVRRELRAVDPTVAVENMRTLDDIRGESLASRTFAMRLLVGFAAVASVLTLVGIYGVLSLSVAARRREIAIRAAIGAGRRDISAAGARRGVAADRRRRRVGHRRRGRVVARAAVVPVRGQPCRSADARRHGSAVRRRGAAGVLGADPPRRERRSARSAALRVGVRDSSMIARRDPPDRGARGSRRAQIELPSHRRVPRARTRAARRASSPSSRRTRTGTAPDRWRWRWRRRAPICWRAPTSKKARRCARPACTPTFSCSAR